MAFSFHTSRPKYYTHFSSLPRVLHVPPSHLYFIILIICLYFVYFFFCSCHPLFQSLFLSSFIFTYSLCFFRSYLLSFISPSYNLTIPSSFLFLSSFLPLFLLYFFIPSLFIHFLLSCNLNQDSCPTEQDWNRRLPPYEAAVLTTSYSWSADSCKMSCFC